MSDTPKTNEFLGLIAEAGPEHYGTLAVDDPWPDYRKLVDFARTLERENAALRERIAELEADLNAWKAGGGTGTIHQWREDAERYRWLREVMTHERHGNKVGWTLSWLLSGDNPDAAIDAARKP